MKSEKSFVLSACLGIVLGSAIARLAINFLEEQSCNKTCYPSQVDICDEHLVLCAGATKPMKKF